MTTSELHQYITKQTQDLPTQLLLEVADFVDFLKTKYNTRNSNVLREMTIHEQHHIDEEFADYKNLYPID